MARSLDFALAFFALLLKTLHNILTYFSVCFSMKIISKFELLLVGLWLGAACFFCVAVAPSAFSVIESRELAGGVVNRTLTILNFSGIAIGVLLILISFISRGEAKSIWAWLQRLVLLIFTAACAVGQGIIGLYLNHLRSLMDGPIDTIPVDSPVRIQFAAWHQYSVWVLITGMIAALIAFFLISRSYSASAAPISTSEGIPDFELPDDLKM